MIEDEWQDETAQVWVARSVSEPWRFHIQAVNAGGVICSCPAFAAREECGHLVALAKAVVEEGHAHGKQVLP